MTHGKMSTLLQALQDRFGGWNSAQVVPIFAQYARVVFNALGVYATHWTTFNEPWTFCFLGYGQGSGAPGLNDKVGAQRPPSSLSLLTQWVDAGRPLNLH